LSHVDWPSRFKKATYGAIVAPSTSAMRTIVSPGELAAADIIASEVVHRLRNDSILQDVFEDRFERVPFISHDDRSTFPKCSVHLNSATNSERPTAIRIEEISIFVGALWSLAYIQPAEDGEASVATVMAHIKRVLTAPANRILDAVYNSVNLSLAVDMAIGGEGFGPLVTLEGRPFGMVHEVEARYTVHVDRDTAQLVNLPPS
jgi:hypothetical protein